MNIRQRVVREALGYLGADAPASHLFTVPSSGPQFLVPTTPPPPVSPNQFLVPQVPINVTGNPPGGGGGTPPPPPNQFLIPQVPATPITPTLTTTPRQPTTTNRYTTPRYPQQLPPPPPPDMTTYPGNPGNPFPPGSIVLQTQPRVPPCGVPQDCAQRMIPFNWWGNAKT